MRQMLYLKKLPITKIIGVGRTLIKYECGAMVGRQ